MYAHTRVTVTSFTVSEVLFCNYLAALQLHGKNVSSETVKEVTFTRIIHVYTSKHESFCVTLHYIQHYNLCVGLYCFLEASDSQLSVKLETKQKIIHLQFFYML